MPGFNNNNNFGGYGNFSNNGNYNIPSSRLNTGYSYPSQFPQNTYQNNYPMMDDRFQLVDYVVGRNGADSYQLPPNVNKAILFDNDNNRFFIKGYDNNGRPRVLDDNDFTPHVEPEPQAMNQPIDLTPYATKDDIQKMISDAFKNVNIPNLSSYMTKADFDVAVSQLSVGNGGRIVRNNEQNA